MDSLRKLFVKLYLPAEGEGGERWRGKVGLLSGLWKWTVVVVLLPTVQRDDCGAPEWVIGVVSGMDSKSQRPLCSRGEWPERRWWVCLWAWLPWILCSRLCSPVLTLWKPESLGSEEIRDSEEEEEPWEEAVWPGRDDMASVSASE